MQADRKYYVATLARLRALRASVVPDKVVSTTIANDFNATLRGLGKREPLFLSLQLTMSALSDLDRMRMTMAPGTVGFPSDIYLSRVEQAISVFESMRLVASTDVSSFPTLADEELRDRVNSLLAGDQNLDVVINQATQLLEVRLRTLSGYKGSETGVGLVSKVLSKRLLSVSDDANEQEGFAHLCRGVVMQFLRNSSHHYFKEVTKDDAYKVCLLVDYLVGVLANARVGDPESDRSC